MSHWIVFHIALPDRRPPAPKLRRELINAGRGDFRTPACPKEQSQFAAAFSPCASSIDGKLVGHFGVACALGCRGHREQAAWLAVPCWPHGPVAQDEKPGSAGPSAASVRMIGQSDERRSFPSVGRCISLAVAAHAGSFSCGRWVGCRGHDSCGQHPEEAAGRLSDNESRNDQGTEDPEQLAEMVLKEAHATGKCADLHSVVVLGPVTQGRSNWHIGTSSNSQSGLRSV